MHINRVIVWFITLLFIFSLIAAISISSEKDNTPPFWNTKWSYRQKIDIPIYTNDDYAKYQPIDIHIKFDHNCWAINERKHSIRICCWDGEKWHEIESQIYDLNFIDTTHIDECSLVFLIPGFANGNEKYYVYYDDSEKPSVKYEDHVSVEESYYSYKLLADVSAEAKYYAIKEDGDIIYGVGQEGKILNRPLSQVIAKQKKGTKNFDIFNSDQIASFAFSYYSGSKEEDESSSDQSLVSKKIFVDGNLMVEFGIASESYKKDLRTTAIYKYYYSPYNDKRISIHLRHEVLCNVTVKGEENIDGRYGALLSFKSKNPAIEKMNTGDILPFLHFYDENNEIREYHMNPNPESKKREWIISYDDDADLGEKAWISYDEGENNGKAHAVIFSSSTGIVKSGTKERDGIQLKVAEKEYFRFLGTEIDYASINFGRNSYENGYIHDTNIPGNLVVEFDAEFFTTENGGYRLVEKEASIYQSLVKHRHSRHQDSFFEKKQEMHDLTIITHLGGTRLSYPYLANKTGYPLPVIWVELYKDDNLFLSGVAHRSPLSRASIKFSDIPNGIYLIKVYWKINNSTRFYNGFKVIDLKRDTKIHIICTWQRRIKINIHDQNNIGIQDVNIILLNKDHVAIEKNITNNMGETLLKAPYNFRDPYILRAYFKGFIIYDQEIKKTCRKISLNLNLYDLTVEVKDALDLPPGVDVRPSLSSQKMNTSIRIYPKTVGSGKFLFEKLPAATYTIQISYGGFIYEKTLHIPWNGDHTTIKLNTRFRLIPEIFDSRGNIIQNQDIDIRILREGREIHPAYDIMTIHDYKKDVFLLPPGNYTIKTYYKNNLVGLQNVELTSDRNIKIVTTLQPMLPTLITEAILIFTGIVLVLTLFKKISLCNLLRLIAIAFLIISLLQPWWQLTSIDQNHNTDVERNIKVFILPAAMIETTIYNHIAYLNIASMPQVFVEMLNTIPITTLIASILISISLIPHLSVRGRGLSHLLLITAIVLILFMTILFYIGMSKLCEVSVGGLYGSNMLDVVVNDETLSLPSNWGLSNGFYIYIVSLLPLILSIVLNLRKNFFLRLWRVFL